MIKFFTNSIQLAVIIVWGITCYYICKSEEGFQYFIFWIIIGFPFGFQKLRMWLIPKGLGIAGEIGVIALDVIVAGLIGGVFLVKKIVVIMADYIRAVGKIFKPKSIIE